MYHHFKEAKAVGYEKMANEKTPALYATKAPFESDEKKDKHFCSRTIVTWVLAVTLLAFLVILCIEFFYPSFEQEFKYDEYPPHTVDGRPFEVTLISPGISTPNDKKPTTGNPWDFEFLIDPANLCDTQNPPNSYQYQKNPEVKLLMLVPSAVDHFKQRNVIRNTWGSVAQRPFSSLRLGFVLGTTNNKTVSDLVQDESFRYNDLIQADFVDSYHHLTTKSVLMLKWVAKRCPHAQYFLKSDDDNFVNVGTIANILRSEPFMSQKKFIGGYVHVGAQPSRTPDEKYYISEDDYPFDAFPPYVSGSAYVMTGPTAVELFDASKEVEPILPQEDVYVTGLCAEHINAPRIHESRFIYDNSLNTPSWNAYSPFATVHNVTPATIERVWNDMTQSVLSKLFDLESSVKTKILLRKKRTIFKLIKRLA